MAVKGSTTISLFVKNLAIAVWGSETLRDSSLEGKTCPRFKDWPAKQRLDANKLLAVKGNWKRKEFTNDMLVVLFGREELYMFSLTGGKNTHRETKPVCIDPDRFAGTMFPANPQFHVAEGFHPKNASRVGWTRWQAWCAVVA